MNRKFWICFLIILSYSQPQSASRLSYLWDKNLQEDSVNITAENFPMFHAKFHFRKYIGLNEVNNRQYYCNRSHGSIELHPAETINSCIPIPSYIFLQSTPQVIALNRCHSWISDIDCQPITVRRKDIPVMIVRGGESWEEVISFVEHTQCAWCSGKAKRKNCSGTWLPHPLCSCSEKIAETTTVLPTRPVSTVKPVQPSWEDISDEDNGRENNNDNVTDND